MTVAAIYAWLLVLLVAFWGGVAVLMSLASIISMSLAMVAVVLATLIAVDKIGRRL